MRECGSSAHSNQKKGGEQVPEVLEGENVTGVAKPLFFFSSTLVPLIH
jgi:hypothetical protein